MSAGLEQINPAPRACAPAQAAFIRLKARLKGSCRERAIAMEHVEANGAVLLVDEARCMQRRQHPNNAARRLPPTARPQRGTWDNGYKHSKAQEEGGGGVLHRSARAGSLQGGAGRQLR